MADRTDAPGVPVITAPLLHAWLNAARAVSESTRELVNFLNVFPVPDADTGTNVLLTVRSACDALALLPPGADLAQTARAAADGAVRGARGNSGLLISQVLAALADVCAEAPDPTALRPVELVHAYERIATTTWAAVSRPVAGTLLTVAQDAATGARTAFEESTASAPPSVSTVAASAAFGAQESVVETAGLGHGAVDAGGAALMLMYTSLSDTIDAGHADAAPGALPASPSATATSMPSTLPCTDVARQMLDDLVAAATHGAGARENAGPFSTGEFEVMYLLEATAAQAAALRRDLEAIGDSVGVVGTPDALGVGMFQVHVHTDTPRAALPRSGRARQVCIHHLHPTALALAPAWEADEPPLPTSAPADGRVVSFERLAARRAQHDSQAAPAAAGNGSHAAANSAPRRVGVIACTRAPGLIEQFARTGAVVVLDPERDGIVRAAGDLGAAQAVVLPCDPQAAASAHAAARFLAARSAVSSVRGAGTGEAARTIPEGVRLLVCDTDDEAGVLAAAVAVAGQGEHAELGELATRAGSVAAAVRTTALTGPDAETDAVAAALTAALRPDDELVTVILGRDALPDVGAVAAATVARYAEQQLDSPDAIEVVIHAGAQPTPDVLLAIG
ncbi:MULTISPECIES: DAK2 domain-containing protein [unclassified Actinomyces]|uniref:DAK2 domain-containing protein n=1 Tax=unclassified Actinomyces TaxID=2609248 RepID=UPI000D58F9D4|nr:MULTISPECIES: DAK2 domain-containing protein [unclassified Actinomyces]RAX22957.1 DAK2 domain-containing protein [Actinomyces sp. Z3]RAX24612.1 DAK2 domain-containing protein [Actinomyces sp. Z5]